MSKSNQRYQWGDPIEIELNESEPVPFSEYGLDKSEPINLKHDDVLTLPKVDHEAFFLAPAATTRNFEDFAADLLPKITLQEYFDLDDFSQTYIREQYIYYTALSHIDKLIMVGILKPNSETMKKMVDEARKRFRSTFLQ